MRPVRPLTPGEMLDGEFRQPLGRTKSRLAKDIAGAAQRNGEIVAGKRSIPADTDLFLCRCCGWRDRWWLRGQAACATTVARESLQKQLARSQSCSLLPP